MAHRIRETIQYSEDVYYDDVLYGPFDCVPREPFRYTTESGNREYTDFHPAPEIHDSGCWDWCNHCALCGVGILWGARCPEHGGVYPENPS